MMAAAAGCSMASVQDRVRDLLIDSNLTVIGFAISNDIEVSGSDLPSHQIIDISRAEDVVRLVRPWPDRPLFSQPQFSMHKKHS